VLIKDVAVPLQEAELVGTSSSNTALTGIVGRVRTPMFLAQGATFLDSHLFGNSVVVGTTTFALTFFALSGGFLSAFFRGLFLGVGIRYYFLKVLKNTQ
jgi:hypothetical protein